MAITSSAKEKIGNTLCPQKIVFLTLNITTRKIDKKNKEKFQPL